MKVATHLMAISLIRNAVYLLKLARQQLREAGAHSAAQHCTKAIEAARSSLRQLRE